MGGFDGEGVQGGSVLVVKTHSSVPMWSKVKGQLAYDLKVSLMHIICIVKSVLGRVLFLDYINYRHHR